MKSNHITNYRNITRTKRDQNDPDRVRPELHHTAAV